jgi:3-phenylpropionate/cinnamic acid dioxygenase small subunit
MTSNAKAPPLSIPAADECDWFGPDAVAIGSATYNQVLQFYYREAYLLDHGKIVAWSELLHPDLIYLAPIRLTRLAADQNPSVVGPGHFDEDYSSIRTRIMRLTQTKSFWAEDPPSRTRRMVTNVLVNRGGSESELLVTSNLLLLRSRLEMTHYQPLSAERRDTLVLQADGLKLARREIVIDQSMLMMPNLAIFL